MRWAVLVCLLLAACGTGRPPDLSMGGASETDPAAQFELGRILLQTDPAQAEHALLAALAGSPRNADILNDLGVARDLQGHHAAAQAAYREALSAEPTLRADVAAINSLAGATLARSVPAE